jgi:hypothetical protein
MKARRAEASGAPHIALVDDLGEIVEGDEDEAPGVADEPVQATES